MRAFLVDAFTEVRFEGNSAGVVLDGERFSTAEKQKIAAEIKASETAFVSKSDIADWRVEFFTPTSQIDFCGHATVATFHILAAEGLLTFSNGTAHSSEETLAGVVPMVVNQSNEGRFSIEMLQRKLQLSELACTPDEIASALKIERQMLWDKYPLAMSNTGNWHAMIGVDSLDALNSIEYDVGLLSGLLLQNGCATAHVFCEDENVHQAPIQVYHARNFCPHIGIPEDPATGAAAGAFCGFLSAHKLIVGKEQTIQIIQGEKMGRPSKIMVSFDPEEQRALVRGHAVTSFILVDPSSRA